MSEKELDKPAEKVAEETENLRKSRRRAISAMAAGSAVVIGKNAPENWIKPVVDHVSLPAHAQTSGGIISASFTISGDDDPDGALTYANGEHQWNGGQNSQSSGDDDFADGDIDDGILSFTANLNPPAAVPVNMTIVADNDWSMNNFYDSETVTSDPGGGVSFSNINFDDTQDDPALIRMRFNAPGYQEAIITVRFTPAP